jgi:hypothetical protein
MKIKLIILSVFILCILLVIKNRQIQTVKMQAMRTLVNEAYIYGRLNGLSKCQSNNFDSKGTWKRDSIYIEERFNKIW